MGSENQAQVLCRSRLSASEPSLCPGPPSFCVLIPRCPCQHGICVPTTGFLHRSFAVTFPLGVLVTTASPLGLTTCSSCVTVTPPRREVPEDSVSQRGNLRPGNKETCMWSLLWSECVARYNGKLYLKAMVLGRGLTGDQTLRSCPGHYTDV